MNFGISRRKPPAESIVPMINVVFLLLIFFLMTAQIAAPDPFEVSPPAAEVGDVADGDGRFYVSADGDVSFDGRVGEAAIAAAASGDVAETLEIYADAALAGAELAKLLAKLTGAGVKNVTLVTVAR
ncbi:ExbD/TolR family protein [Aliiroseovarius sp. YM-037]|uniref:ExbD/TolR family protein n=1 Tax=Aliiroseovarius sp. YM-037 TaxID=3341728 RepID=UPI003A8094BF